MPPVNDLLARPGADFSVSGFIIGDGFGKIDLTVLELVTQQADVSGAIAEAFSYDPVWQALDETGAQCLIAALPAGGGVGKKIGAPRVLIILYVGYRCQYKMLKHEENYCLWKLKKAMPLK